MGRATMSDKPDLSRIPDAEIRHWIKGCCEYLEQETTPEAREARERQIRVLWAELDRRGETEKRT
jgi:hypothetical protein